MSNAIPILLAIACGGFLAIVYFGGLWWTICRLPLARSPAALYSCSLMFRLAIVLTSLYIVIANCDWPVLAACLIGFFSTRLIVMHFYGRETAPLLAANRTR